VLPSRAEGFGLPLIEAMNLRTPVVLSDDAALVEVAGGAGVVAKIISSDAADVGDASRELNRALDESFDRKGALVEAGLRRSADFSWTSTAMRVTHIHQQLTSRS
jgi:glycosyltransferase involved in cell wall biosynthesis